MNLKFLGAAQTVTGSRYLVTTGTTKVLVDCGLFQGFKHLRTKNWDDFPENPEELDAVVLSHSHLDHSGYLPALYNEGFRGPVYCTAATRDLCRIMLLDSGYLQEEEARLANLKGFSKHHPAKPLYTEKDAELSLTLFKPVEWGQPFKVKDLTVQFTPAGHLLGAASVHLSNGDTRLLFSGDLGRSDDPLMRAPVRPPATDWLVMESTYGDRLHDKTDPEEELAAVINRVAARGGTIVIPTFAVGRAQAVMYFLHRLKQNGRIDVNLPIYLNSPMANAVNGVYVKYADEHKLGRGLAHEVCAVARPVSRVEDSITVDKDPSPKIILAASGMATGGRVLHHLKTYGPDPKSAIVFVGYQAGGTRGEALVRGAEEIKIHGQYWPIHAEVHHLESLSAHADAAGLVAWASGLQPAPRRVFLTHGEPAAAEALRLRLKKELGWEAEVPEPMSSYDSFSV